MRKNLTIKNVDDYYRILNVEAGLFEPPGSSRAYQIHPEFGQGLVERISLRHGVEISIWTMELLHDLEITCQMEEACFEILYCAAGQASYGDYENGSHSIIKGDEYGCWLNHGSRSWVHFSAGHPWRSISVCYEESFIESFLEMALAEGEAPKVKSILQSHHKGSGGRYYCSPDVELAFYQIMHCSHQGIARLLFMESKAMELFSYCIQDKLALPRGKNDRLFSQQDCIKLEQAKRIIVENMVEPLSIEQLSRDVNLNTYKLKVGFKKIWGTTVFGYLRHMRMEKARLLLADENKSVMEVALEVGYSNPSHFSAAFRSKYGLNPHEYARRKAVKQ